MFPILDLSHFKFTKPQRKVLMESFQANKYPTEEEKCKLAMSLNVTKNRIIKWYKHMRYTKGVKERSSQG